MIALWLLAWAIPSLDATAAARKQPSSPVGFSWLDAERQFLGISGTNLQIKSIDLSQHKLESLSAGEATSWSSAMHRISFILFAATVACSLGCQTGPNFAAGGLLGGTTGGILGGAIGARDGKAGEGALIGAVAGGLAGAAIGNQQDANEIRAIEQVNQANRGAQAAYEQAVSESAITFAQVVQMTQSGLSEAIIVNQLQVNGVLVRPTPNDLIGLKSNGVSDRVINAIQTAPLAGHQVSQAYPPAPNAYAAQAVYDSPAAYPPQTVIVESAPVVGVIHAPGRVVGPGPRRGPRRGRGRPGFGVSIDF